MAKTDEVPKASLFQGPRPLVILLLSGLLVLLGAGALWGSLMLILAPSGSIIENTMHLPKEMLTRTPFRSYLIPGILLFIINCLYPLAMAFSLWKRPAWKWPDRINPFKPIHWSWAGSMAAGATLIIWIAVQASMFGKLYFPHYPCFGWGAVIILLTLLPGTRRYCSPSRA